MQVASEMLSWRLLHITQALFCSGSMPCKRCMHSNTTPIVVGGGYNTWHVPLLRSYGVWKRVFCTIDHHPTLYLTLWSEVELIRISPLSPGVTIQGLYIGLFMPYLYPSLILSLRMSELCLYKWKNHFSEMKGDLGVADHEKGGKKQVAYPIPTSLLLSLT